MEQIPWSEITQALTTIATLGGFLWKLVSSLQKKLKDMILVETQYISKKLHEHSKQLKDVNAYLDTLKQSILELKAMESSQRSVISQLEIGIKAAIEANTRAIQDNQKTEAEWLSETLVKIKEMANKKKGD